MGQILEKEINHFIDQLPETKRNKLKHLLDDVPYESRQDLLAQLFGLDIDGEAEQEEAHDSVSSDEQKAESKTTAEEVMQPADPLSDQSREELKHSLSSDKSLPIMLGLFSPFKALIHSVSAEHKYTADLDQGCLLIMWKWFWLNEASNKQLELMNFILNSKGAAYLPEKKEKAKELRGLMAITFQQLHKRVARDERLLMHITDGQDLPRFGDDLADFAILLSGEEALIRFGRSIPRKLPRLNKSIIQYLIIELRKYEKLPQALFSALAYILMRRLDEPCEIPRIADHIVSSGGSLEQSPFLVYANVPVCEMDRLAKFYREQKKAEAPIHDICKTISQFSNFSRAFRINVDTYLFPEIEKRFISIQRSYSIILEREFKHLMEYVKRILRTVSWIRDHPHTWSDDKVDLVQCQRLVQEFYSVEKVASEFSLQALVPAVKKEFEDYIEFILKSLLSESNAIGSEEVVLFNQLSQQALDFAAYSFEPSYLKHFEIKLGEAMRQKF